MPDPPLRWSDLDAYGHVNNAEMLSLLEEARIQAFWVSADTPEHAVGASHRGPRRAARAASTITLIARQEMEYLAPIPYLRQPLDIELWIGDWAARASTSATRCTRRPAWSRGCLHPRGDHDRRSSTPPPSGRGASAIASAPRGSPTSASRSPSAAAERGRGRGYQRSSGSSLNEPSHTARLPDSPICTIVHVVPAATATRRA